MSSVASPNVPGEWVERAACRGYPIDWWYPTFECYAGKSAREAREDAAVAMRICAELCPVKAECLVHALRHREYGVWGGTTDRQRIAIRVLLGKEQAA